MRSTRVKAGPFHRIGDSYATFFDRDHFMGRSAFEDGWLTKSSRDLLVRLGKDKHGNTRLEVLAPIKPVK